MGQQHLGVEAGVINAMLVQGLASPEKGFSQSHR